MPDPVTGIIAGSTVVGGVVQGRSASKAAKAQTQASEAGIAEQRRQFDAMQRLLNPYVQAGTPALQNLMALAGLGPTQTNWTGYAQSSPDLMQAYQDYQSNFQAQPQYPAGFGYGIGDLQSGLGTIGSRGGMFQPPQQQPMSLEQFAQQYYRDNGGDISQFQTDPQAQAVARLEGSPMFQALARQGEEAILQNASATGGLRGGNVQGALARFRPQLLNQFIEQQYGRLAGITSLGQQSAAGVGTAGLQTGTNIAQSLAQAGAARAAGIGAQGQIWGNVLGGLGGTLAGAIKPAGGAF